MAPTLGFIGTGPPRLPQSLPPAARPFNDRGYGPPDALPLKPGLPGASDSGGFTLPVVSWGDLVKPLTDAWAALWNWLNYRPRPVPEHPDDGVLVTLQPTDSTIRVYYTNIQENDAVFRCLDNVKVNDASKSGGPANTQSSGVGVRMKRGTAKYSLGCGGSDARTPVTLGFDIVRANGTVSGGLSFPWSEGVDARGPNYSGGFRRTIAITGFRYGGQDYPLPSAPDTTWQPSPLPERPFMDPDTAPTLPQPAVVPSPTPAPAPPDVEPLPAPASPPSPLSPPSPTITPTVPGRTPLVVPFVPGQPATYPDPPATPFPPPGPGQAPGFNPDGTPLPVPQPVPVPLPPTIETIGDLVIGQPGTSPPPTLEGIAQEVGKIEQKTRYMVEKAQEAAAEPEEGDLTDILQLLGEILEFLQSLHPAGSYELAPPCEEGEPFVASWAAGSGTLSLVSKKLDAIAGLIQAHKDMRQPICHMKASGQPVTVNFLEV